jgi:hypothetical protein
VISLVARMVLIVEERIFIVESYNRNRSYEASRE